MLNLENRVVITSNNVRFPDRLNNAHLIPSDKVIPGDIGLFEVLSHDGGYIVQLNLEGQETRLGKGDYVVGVFGIRQSGTNISGDIPSSGIDTVNGDIFQLLSSSTIVGHARRVPEHISENAVDLRLEGILSLDGTPMNIAELTQYKPYNRYDGQTAIMLALGSSAECGKTTVTSELIKSFTQRGLKVAASKTNGSGNIRDKYSMRDSGAIFYLDFVDFGLTTTYEVLPEKYLSILKGILNEAERTHPDLIILECGGDVMWGNVPTLLREPEVVRNVVAVTMCSTDYMAAYGAYIFLREQGVSAPVLFDVPIAKENFYRKRYFENLVNLQVYDVMKKDEREAMISALFQLVSRFKNEGHRQIFRTGVF